MKKLIAMLLALVMVLSLAACGASAPATEAPKAEEPKAEAAAPAPEAEAPAAEEVELVSSLNFTFLFYRLPG